MIYMTGVFLFTTLMRGRHPRGRRARMLIKEAADRSVYMQIALLFGNPVLGTRVGHQIKQHTAILQFINKPG